VRADPDSLRPFACARLRVIEGGHDLVAQHLVVSGEHVNLPRRFLS
jgi:hypothetical protein